MGFPFLSFKHSNILERFYISLVLFGGNKTFKKIFVKSQGKVMSELMTEFEITFSKIKNKSVHNFLGISVFLILC